jgi:hypothetical protein
MSILSVRKTECPLASRRSEGKHTPGVPSPRAQVALDLIDAWRKKQKVTGPGVPRVIQDEAWEIAFHPTEWRPILSRNGNPRGMSVFVARIPSFLKS